MNFLRHALPFFFASFGVIFTSSALAQYAWLDASGRKVFSDQPPPANIPTKRILQQPGKAIATEPSKSTELDDKPKTEAAGEIAKTSPTPKIVTKDKDLEAAKKKADDETAAKKKAEQEKVDAAKADNCIRAKQAKGTLDSGVRLSHTNTKGERGFMDDATRMVETKRVEGIIAADCK